MPDETVKRILLSSPPGELLDHANRVIERLHGAAIDTRAVAAGPESPLSEHRSLAASVDALVVLIGRRSPWIPEEEDGGDGEKSIAIWEVEAAREAGVPVLAFVRKPESAQAESDSGGAKAGGRKRASYLSELDRVLEGPRIEALVFWLAEQTAAPPERFSTPDDLATRVESALGSLWARAETLPEELEEPELEEPETTPSDRERSPTSPDDSATALAPDPPAPEAPAATARFPRWALGLLAALLVAAALALLAR